MIDLLILMLGRTRFRLMSLDTSQTILTGMRPLRFTGQGMCVLVVILHVTALAFSLMPRITR